MILNYYLLVYYFVNKSIPQLCVYGILVLSDYQTLFSDVYDFKMTKVLIKLFNLKKCILRCLNKPLSHFP